MAIVVQQEIRALAYFYL